MPDTDSKKAACLRTAVFRQYLAAFIANLSALSFGTMLGWTSPMQPLLTSENPPVGNEPMSSEVVSWLGSLNYIGAVCGTFFWGIASDRLGRKYTAIIVAIPFIIGWITTITAQNVWMLLIARIVIGVGCSGVIINTPIYVSEIAGNTIRGSLGSFLTIFVDAGCVFSYIVGSYTSYHVLSAICLCIPIIFLLLFPLLPESPVYLLTHRERVKAEDSLLWFRGGDEVQTMKEIEAFKLCPGQPKSKIEDLYRSKGVKKAMIISIGFVIGRQFCGILAILTYTVEIFKQSGSSLSAHNSMIVVGLLQFFAALISSFLVDRAGRRILLITSYLALFLSLATLSGYLYFQQDNWDPIVRWIPIVCLSIYVTSYSFGVGPVVYVVISEIFPPHIRGFATSKIQLLSTCLSFASVKTFPFLTDVLGSYGSFLFYAVFCAILSVFTFILVPETKGKTIENILRQLNGEDTKSENNKYSELCIAEQNELIVRNQIT